MINFKRLSPPYRIRPRVCPEEQSVHPIDGQPIRRGHILTDLQNIWATVGANFVDAVEHCLITKPFDSRANHNLCD
jgi:hypothetical protein